MTDYNDGEWHVWNGGECPVHPATQVSVQCANETRISARRRVTDAGDWDWLEMGDAQIIAFRVVTPYVEPVKLKEDWHVWSKDRPGNPAYWIGRFNTREEAERFVGGCADDRVVHMREVIE